MSYLKDFVNSKKNQKYNDTKDYTSLLVIG